MALSPDDIQKIHAILIARAISPHKENLAKIISHLTLPGYKLQIVQNPYSKTFEAHFEMKMAGELREHHARVVLHAQGNPDRPELVFKFSHKEAIDAHVLTITPESVNCSSEPIPTVKNPNASQRSGNRVLQKNVSNLAKEVEKIIRHP